MAASPCRGRDRAAGGRRRPCRPRHGGAPRLGRDGRRGRDGYLERRLQNFDAALAHYAKALALAPEHTGALHYQAETFLALGRLDEAEANLARIEAVCDFPCPDGDDLAEQIALYRKNLDG